MTYNFVDNISKHEELRQLAIYSYKPDKNPPAGYKLTDSYDNKFNGFYCAILKKK